MTINTKEKTLVFNSGGIQKYKTEKSSCCFYIKSYLGNYLTQHLEIKINSTKDRILVDFIDGSVSEKVTYKRVE